MVSRTQSEVLNPTKKQRELLLFIDGFIKGNGYGPSYREIMRALDYKSVSTVATHVDGLIALGLLRKRVNSARSLEVVGSAPRLRSVEVPSTTERDIRTKIVELQQLDTEEAKVDIAALRSALRILGYNREEDEAEDSSKTS